MNNGKADTTLQDLQKLQQQLQRYQRSGILMIFIYYLCLPFPFMFLVSYLLLEINKNSSQGRSHFSGVFQK